MVILSGKEREYWLGLAALPGVGARRFFALLRHFGTAQAAWFAADKDWDGVGGLSFLRWQKTLEARKTDFIGKLLHRLSATDTKTITLMDDNYPELLRNIPDPPPVIYVRGQIRWEDQAALAIVGTRNPSAYGEKVCQRFAQELVSQGRTVVSGLARGIDGIAHLGALDAGGRTIAVLASGVDFIYPPEHKKLAARIVEQGALVSEYPPGTPPEPGKFPARNRVISGLSQGVIVVEAGEKSGALITADQALEQGREVFAVPGPITISQSIGPNRLIQQGAKLVTSIEDVLAEAQLILELPVQLKEESSELSQTEKLVLSHLNWEPKSADDLVKLTGLPSSEVAISLTMLEIKGMTKTFPGGRFVSG